MKQQTMCATRRGFTLLELLVVIGIIGLLVTMIAPQLSNVKRKAGIAACRSNLKGSTTGFHSYAQDHNGVLPQIANMAVSVPSESPSLPEAMSEYVGNVFKCPGDRFVPYYATEGTSYEYNGFELAGNKPEDLRLGGYTWVLQDISWFHGSPWEVGSLNYLLLDGEVRGFGEKYATERHHD